MTNVELISLLVIPVALYFCFIGNLFRTEICRINESPSSQPSPQSSPQSSPDTPTNIIITEPV